MEIDALDRQIIHALRVNGRAGYREIGAVLGVSDQTVARRYRRLREGAGVRVAGLPNPIALGYEMWLLRLRTTPDAAGAIAAALARRSDTGWVSLTSGGTEIAANVQLPATADRDALLLDRLPRTPRLISVSAHCMIHHFAGGAVGADQRDNSLTPAQIAALTPAPHTAPGPPRLTDDDRPLLAALAHDGRLGFPELAAATGWAETTVRRRLHDLTGSGALFYDVDVDPDVLGFRARVLLWLSVAPSRVAAVGAAIAGHEEIVFAAATTGPTNLVATVVCHDMTGLYTYLTEKIGALDGVDRVETAPLVRHIKQSGAVTTSAPPHRT
ncbi:AsnC family transcriptional regulator [Asanoa ferruginea]|uniref:AsnC family transcriptional regulator n=1 Tax=Asanoa ferruginea TaxID=53367 RepID=A0A3D9ZZ83_9ACTN|nr:AsnC family transcriptional regulator [Asanoa ferruginea]REG02396.1 AsnC family transcriptional regulator [Asanoa ferruginea]GIF46631.1 AsnC family transcriptional regulator [Asanoa ferruginea]